MFRNLYYRQGCSHKYTGAMYAGQSCWNNAMNPVLSNRVYGSSVSKPQGFNSERAIIMPVVSGSNIAAILRGGSDFSGVITAIGNLTTEASGSGTVSAANGNMAANMSANPSGTCTLTFSIEGKGWMSATIDVGAHPSAFDIVQAVLNALAADYNRAGTIGQKINGAGSAGDPWSDSRALTVAKFLGLK